MNRSILTIALLYPFLTTIGQNICISSDQHIDIYNKEDNIITIMVEKFPCDHLIVTTDNGKIIASNDCRFRWVPERLGEGQLTIYRILRKDTFLVQIERW